MPRGKRRIRQRPEFGDISAEWDRNQFGCATFDQRANGSQRREMLALDTHDARHQLSRGDIGVTVQIEQIRLSGYLFERGSQLDDINRSQQGRLGGFDPETRN
jgi:hypothetical protein